jgi:hypothetical protein
VFNCINWDFMLPFPSVTINTDRRLSSLLMTTFDLNNPSQTLGEWVMTFRPPKLESLRLDSDSSSLDSFLTLASGPSTYKFDLNIAAYSTVSFYLPCMLIFA